MSDTAERVKRIITEVACLPEPPDDDTPLMDVPGDDLDRIEMLFEIEDAFDIEISDDQAEGFLTVRDVIAFVEART